jgi:curved DNA-binding protein
MSVKFKDYYKILGVSRSATQDEIKKAYRKLARKYHPDVNKDKDAEDRFKEISEAYEVIGDTEKRKQYDELGANWKSGQDFTPPPGWQPPTGGGQWHFYTSEGGPGEFTAGDMGGFSDFFDMLFGGMGGGPRTGGPSRRRTRQWNMRGQDHETEIPVTLEEVYHGAKKNITLQSTDIDQHGQVQRQTRNLNVTIPRGATEGTRIRLPGQGGKGVGDAPSGHLFMRLHIQPHPRFKVSGHNLEMTLPLAPWEAALGAQLPVKMPDGKSAKLTIPSGTQGGTQLRLKGKGLPQAGRKPPGDLIVIVQIAIPRHLNEAERRLFEDLAATSSFKPR